MRFRLTLKALHTPCNISIDYSYYLSNAIYRWIEFSSPSYSEFLHDKGFALEGTTKRFKHFCFSQLFPQTKNKPSTVHNGRITIHSPFIDWYIAMPVEESLRHLIIGMFEKREFHIGNAINRFIIDSISPVSDPHWQRQMKFKLLSPITVSTMREHNGKMQPYYLLPDDERLSRLLRSNILNKYISLNGKEPDDTEFACTLDKKYIERKQAAGKKITTLTTIKKGQPEETKVRGFMCPLTIVGNPELIKLAYEGGLGEKNSLGFGMLEAL